MIQSMRQLAHSFVFKGLMLILVVSFGIWGIGDIFRGNPMTDIVAKAGSASITVQELKREFEHNLVQARRSFGPELTAQQAKDFGFLDMTLSSMIDKAELEQATHKLGIDVSEKSVLDSFARDPHFQDKDGKFDKELVRNMLSRTNMGERDFVNQQRQNDARSIILSAFENQNTLPQTIVDAVAAAKGQKRILDVITLKDDSIANIPAPTDKALHEFYEKNPKQFTAPEYRGMTIAVLSADAVAKDISISDEQLRKEFESRSAQYERPELRTILQVVTQDENKAKELASAAQSSGDLGKAAKAQGLSAIPIDETDKRSLMTQLADPVFDLKVGEIAGPVKTDLGWHVVQLKKIIDNGKPSFDSMKDELRETMRKDQAVETVTRMVNQWDDDLAAGRNLEEIADGLKLHMIKIKALDANGKTPEGKDPSELPNRADVLKTAFGQNSGETSPVMDDKNGSYVVVRTDDITPSAVMPYDKVAARVAAIWKADVQDTRARAEAEKIAADLRHGKSVASIETRKGLEIHTSKPISQIGDDDAEMPQMLMPQILKMKKGDVVTWPLEGKQMILHVAQVIPVDLAHDAKARGRVTEELNDQMPKELAATYLKHLRTLFPVTIKQELLDGIVQTQPQGN